MALRSFTIQAIKGLPLILGMGLLAACNSEDAANDNNNLVVETQGCSRGAMALFASCGDQNAATNELQPNNDTPPAGDTSVIITGGNSEGDSQSDEVVLDDVVTHPNIETDTSTQPIQDVEPNYDEEIAQISRAWADYGAEVLSTHQDNHIESVHQAAHTLTMLGNGAGTGPATDTPYLIVKENGDVIDPNTLKAIVGSLYGTTDGIEHLHQLLNHWDQKLLDQNPSLDWQHNNGMWKHEGYLFLDSYLDTLSQYYEPEMTDLSFMTNVDGSRQIISAWISNISQDALTPLMTFNGNQIDERTRVVTLNSEAVKAAWPELFDVTQTTDERFKMLDGTMKLVPTMHTTGTFDTVETDQYQAFQLPIKDSTLALLVIMPKAEQFETVQTQLGTSPLLEQIIAALQPINTTLHLPHFSIATTEEIEIPSASDEEFADFSAVNGQGYLYLKQMAQMATIDVAESGLVARAGGMSILDATQDEPLSVWNLPDSSDISAIWMTQYTGMAPTPCYYPALLHPFMFVIRDITTSTVLYAGVWTTPPGAEMIPDWTIDAFGQGVCENTPPEILSSEPEVVWP
jgi:serine protease inhibitor